MQDDTQTGRNPARSAAMKAALIDAARAIFAEKGYAETGTPEIVRAAGVTRGALYHHFDGKPGLFRAVLEQEAEAISRRIQSAAGTGRDARSALMAGAKGYFDAMRDPERQRLMLRDGPAVLGPAGMAEIDARAGRDDLLAGLQALFGPTPPDTGVQQALADILSAGFDRMAQHPDRTDAALAAFDFLFQAISEATPNAGRGETLPE